jgi:hypothetical protein
MIYSSQTVTLSLAGPPQAGFGERLFDRASCNAGDKAVEKEIVGDRHRHASDQCSRRYDLLQQ